MKLTAKKVPYSSIVGQSVTLQDASGRIVCQLAILNPSPIGEVDHKTVSGRYADAICAAFDDNKRIAGLETMLCDAQAEIASLKQENGRLRTVFRANMLRYAPAENVDAEIDRVLNNRTS